ncbi:MAG TPA: hypothetical protein P5081_16080 [Phycisphaerae bacterium]|nr:hypothetical protein [Phycisphaerae bacterium]HRW54389.1 hypothetical protein [Phycisphaerae bacterium]
MLKWIHRCVVALLALIALMALGVQIFEPDWDLYDKNMDRCYIDRGGLTIIHNCIGERCCFTYLPSDLKAPRLRFSTRVYPIGHDPDSLILNRVDLSADAAWFTSLSAPYPLLVLALWYRRRRRRRAMRHHCVQCEYDLTGVESDRCPECGTARETPR